METKLSLLHRILLWFAILNCGIFGLGYYFLPSQFTTAIGIDAPDPLAIRSIGGFMIAAAVGCWLSLRSGRWAEVRIVTIYLITWNVLNSLRIWYGMAFEGQSLSLLPNGIVTAILGIGLLIVYFQQPRQTAHINLKTGLNPIK